MALRCGIDIVEIVRIKNALEGKGDRFKKRVFTETEIGYCEARNNSRFESFAAGFCAKEAVSKALGTGFGNGIDLRDIEILHNDSGKPFVQLYNRAKDVFETLGAVQIEISLSHCKEYAVASCILI